MIENNAEEVILESIKLACKANGLPVRALYTDADKEALGFESRSVSESRRSTGTAGNYLKNKVSRRVGKPLSIWVQELAMEWGLVRSTAENPKPLTTEHATKILQSLEKARAKRHQKRFANTS